MTSRLLPALGLFLLASLCGSLRAEGLRLVSATRIWNQAPHNAFTDLIRWRDHFWCVFREGADHVSPDGALRVISSADGQVWASSARITLPGIDLRDAKICVTPDGRLMLSGAGAHPPPSPVRHRSLVWFSADGSSWSEPVQIGDDNQWLWRVTWNRDTAWSIGYDTVGEAFIRLYRSDDGRDFRTVVPRLFDEQQPNEHALHFASDGSVVCLLRRDGSPGEGMLGRASGPDYSRWEWRKTDRRIGGPALLGLPDGRLLAGVRLYDGKVRTSLCWVDTAAATLTEALPLPSGGDTSYPGLVWHSGEVWVSYYSSHEGRTSIYLARVALTPRP